jgi:hypothetical protein
VDWTLERYVVPLQHDPSPLVRSAINFVLTEELEHEMVREARAARPTGWLAHCVSKGGHRSKPPPSSRLAQRR